METSLRRKPLFGIAAIVSLFRNDFISAQSAWLLPLLACLSAPALAQNADTPADADPGVAATIEVEPAADDPAIAARIDRILAATPWFEDIDVRVEQGIVFLTGSAQSDERAAWAEQIALNTRDVVAVINDLQIRAGPLLDLSPAWQELRRLTTNAIRHAPVIAIALLVALLTLFIGRRSINMTSTLLEGRIDNPLLRDVAARLIPIPLFLLGIYLVLSILGLTGLAVTIIGGTGLAGLVIGFAFRDIAENFLASVLLSVQKPFATGDLISVAGNEGFVQNVNTRSTLLMTREGNFIQVPNAIVYKNTITNYTANPLARHDFLVGIGYDDSISDAQAIARSVLVAHPAIGNDPEPLVLVESLGAATVNLRAYFWIDITRYSHLKVRSAVIRLTKQAFDDAGISMPDEAREVVFPQGVPVQIQDPQQSAGAPRSSQPPTGRTRTGADSQRATDAGPEAFAVAAEGALTTDAEELDDQARRSRTPEGDTNLLDD